MPLPAMKPIEQQSDAELLASLRDAAALPDAPAAAVHAAIGLWPRPNPVAAALRRLQAVLAFDSWAAGPLAAGLRGGGAAARHLVFSVEGRDVDLRIDATRAGYVLTGQVLGPDEHGRVALARAAGGTPQSSAIDDMGEFAFEPVPAGAYRVTLEWAAALVELPPIEVGEQR